MSSGFGAAAECLLELVLLGGGASIEPRRRSSLLAIAWYRLAMFDTLTGERGVSRIGD